MRQYITDVQRQIEDRIVIKFTNIVTVMESRFPAMQVLWLGREFYKVKHGVTSATLMARMTFATYFPDSNFSLQQACHKFVMTRVQVCHKFVMTSVQACSKLAAS
ncbi:hypothetical protein AVEN_146113-1 [Araneus ventricosus]|uniref:Uncharacterized protein n=1 Tax=Araneus ventricosus TaxID=182803 RepID=A0A4Y2IEV3_ARAVE|nr:hypothetical protein AVEN_146113-1 [Araneus ventricosus]